MMAIISAYQGQGGLTRFLLDQASGALPPGLDRQYRDALASIAATI